MNVSCSGRSQSFITICFYKIDRMNFAILLLLVLVSLLTITPCYGNKAEQLSLLSSTWSSPSSLSPSLDTNLAKDLNEIREIIPTKAIYRLFLHYLFTDEQFQRIVRTVLTRDGYTVLTRLRSQPEVVALTKWTRTQLLLAREDVSSMEVSSELSDVIKYMQTWSNRKVNGWRGFVEEFLMLYPEDLLKTYVHMKVQENGIFAQFWQQVRNVRDAYERVLLMPETQRVLHKLEANGVDTTALDLFIRRQFDW